MTLTLVPHPMAGSITRTTQHRNADPEIPPGQPVITRLGSYTARNVGEQLALACRTCHQRFAGDAHDVHADLREHWVAQHKPVPTVSLIKTNHRKPLRRSAAGIASYPCTTLMVRGPRSGKPCGRGSADGTCAQHQPKRMEAQRAISRARNATVHTPHDCDECGVTFTRRKPGQRFCTPACRVVHHHRLETARLREQRVGKG